MSRRVAYRSNTTRRGAHRCSHAEFGGRHPESRAASFFVLINTPAFLALPVTAFDLLEPTSLWMHVDLVRRGIRGRIRVVRTVARNRSVVGAPSPCCTPRPDLRVQRPRLSPSARRLRLIRRPSGGSGRN